MERYIIDTNLFFNMEAGIELGLNTEEVVKNITKIAKQMEEELRSIYSWHFGNREEEFPTFWKKIKLPHACFLEAIS